MHDERRMRLAALNWELVGGGPPLAEAARWALGDDVGLRAVVLVEGASDRTAVETLADRCGRDLAAEGIAVVPIGGATSIAHFLGLFGPQGLDVGLMGLCDAAEERVYRRGLERAGLGDHLDRAGLERLGFFVCEADLEDELIRTLGAAEVERVIEEQGELPSFRILQKQPAQRERTPAEQLHRFMGSRGGRKTHYARVLVEALALDHIPRSLELLLRAGEDLGGRPPRS